MTKKNIMPVVVLTVICVIVAALLGGVNELTKGKIKENALKKEQASLIEVLPGAATFEEIKITAEFNLPQTVKSAYKEASGKGHVLIMATSTSYSSEDMTISVGVSPEGKVTGVKLTNYKESKDFGKETYPQKYVGTTADSYDDVEVVSGVTYSSNAFKAAIGDAISAAAILSSRTTASLKTVTLLSASSEELPKTDAQLLSLMGEMIPGAKEIKRVELSENAPYTLNALYKESTGKGYVAHIIVPGQYVPIATEALVYIGERGAVKDIKLLKWIVGHGVGPGDFAEGFIGSSKDTVGDVELVSSATITSADFRKSVSDTINYIVPESTGWRVLGILTLVIIVAAFTSATVIPKFLSRRRRTDK